MATKALFEIDLSKACFLTADDSAHELFHDMSTCEEWCDMCDISCDDGNSCDND